MNKKKSRKSGYSRRDLLKIGGGATALGATGMAVPGPQNPTQRAEAIAPLVAAGAGAVAGYLLFEVVDHFTGDSVNTDELQSLDATSLHNQLYKDALSMAGSDDTVNTLIKNRLQDTQHVAWSKAKKAGVEQLNLGNPEADAQTAATDAVNTYYSTIQRNLLNHWQEQMNKWQDMETTANNHSNLSWGTVFNMSASGTQWSPSVNSYPTVNTTLLDGSTYNGITGIELKWYNSGYDPEYERYDILAVQGTNNNNLETFAIVPPDTGDSASPLLGILSGGSNMFNNRWNEIQNQASSIKSEVSTYITELYSNFEPGEIDITNFLDPAQIAAEKATKTNGEDLYGFAAAELAALGMHGNYNVKEEIYLVEDDRTVEGMLWFDDPSITLKVGTEYDPSLIAGGVVLAYEYTGTDKDGNEVKKADLTELKQKFAVVSAVNTKTGEKINEISHEEYVQQTSDVNVTQEELQKIRDLEKQIEKQRQEILNLQEDTSDGGGIDLSALSLFGLTGEKVALGATGLVALFALLNQN